MQDKNSNIDCKVKGDTFTIQTNNAVLPYVAATTINVMA